MIVRVIAAKKAEAAIKALGRLPQRLLLYAIEGERFDAGAELRPAVERAVAAVAGELRELLSAARR